MKKLYLTLILFGVSCGQGSFIEKKDNELTSGASFQTAEAGQDKNEILFLETDEDEQEVTEEDINNFNEGGENHPCDEVLSEPAQCRVKVRGVAKKLRHVKSSISELVLEQLYAQGGCIPPLSEVYTIFTIQKINFELSVSIELEINGV